MNSSIPLGGIALINRVDKRLNVFSEVFSGIGGRSKDFIGCVKLHVYNKLTHGVSTHQILETYPSEVAAYLGMKEMPAERSLYRTFDRIGRRYPVALEKYQSLLKKHNLVDPNQVSDFSSAYFEGKNAELGKQGYSRDHRPDRPQVNFGITTGINGIPTALTIQNGNVQDKKHMRDMLKVVEKVLSENSLLIFDTGANTRQNKAKIRKIGFHYLTLKAKKVKVYARYINEFKKSSEVHEFMVNERHYRCVKKRENDETQYILFCQELYEDQMHKRRKKFQRQKKKGDKILTQRKTEKIPSKKGWVELEPHLQKTIQKLENPYINGTEGYFILESSLDEDPEKILRLYKERDKAEKFIRALKEGLELRPVRHWTKWAIIGLFFVCFLTNFLINLTQKMSEAKPEKPSCDEVEGKDARIVNVKLLKKYLTSLTLTVVYPENSLRFTVLSNITPPIQALFGDYVQQYEDKTLKLRW